MRFVVTYFVSVSRASCIFIRKGNTREQCVRNTPYYSLYNQDQVYILLANSLGLTNVNAIEVRFKLFERESEREYAV